MQKHDWRAVSVGVVENFGSFVFGNWHLDTPFVVPTALLCRPLVAPTARSRVAILAAIIRLRK
jgi:hypothetical protein